MPFQELIFSFVIGIASGIVSSVMVTVFYRIKDGEKDRQAFFSTVKEYIGGLIAIPADDIEAMSAFYSSHEYPRIFKWIRLTKDEHTILDKLDDRISELQDVIVNYYLEASTVYDPILAQQEAPMPSEATINAFNDSLKEKYHTDIVLARTRIIVMRAEIDSLGNKEMTKIMKKIQKQRRS